MTCRTLLALSLFLAATAGLAFSRAGEPQDADGWKQRVMERAGIEAWASATRLRFTFNVEADGEVVMQAEHDWDLRTGIDTVRWSGREVSVNVSSPGEGEDEQAAFRRWTNDSYWLLMPLKLGDEGVRVELLGNEEVDGQEYVQLRLSFEGVGLTPGDVYHVYVDNEGLVRWWDYMPTPERRARFWWGEYADFNGLTLATERRAATEEGAPRRRIYFTDIEVERG